MTKGRSTLMFTIAYLLYAVGTTLAAFGAWFIAIILIAIVLVVVSLYVAARATGRARPLLFTLGGLIAGAASAWLLPEPAGGTDAERITAWAIVAWAIVLHPPGAVWLRRLALVVAMIGIGYALPEPHFDTPHYQLIMLLAIPIVFVSFTMVERRLSGHSTEDELLRGGRS